MGKAARPAKAPTGAIRNFDHLTLDSFKPFQGHEIASIDDLSDFMEKFGVYRIYIRSPNSKSKLHDRLEAEEGSWEVGLRLNKFYYDWVRTGPCATLHEALERALGIKIVSPGAQSKPAAVAASEDDEGLLV